MQESDCPVFKCVFTKTQSWRNRGQIRGIISVLSKETRNREDKRKIGNQWKAVVIIIITLILSINKNLVSTSAPILYR